MKNEFTAALSAALPLDQPGRAELIKWVEAADKCDGITSDLRKTGEAGGATHGLAACLRNAKSELIEAKVGYLAALERDGAADTTTYDNVLQGLAEDGAVLPWYSGNPLGFIDWKDAGHAAHYYAVRGH